MTDLAAALGLPQLAKIEEHWPQRGGIWSQYNQQLRDLPLLAAAADRARVAARLPSVHAAAQA